MVEPGQLVLIVLSQFVSVDVVRGHDVDAIKFICCPIGFVLTGALTVHHILFLVFEACSDLRCYKILCCLYHLLSTRITLYIISSNDS